MNKSWAQLMQTSESFRQNPRPPSMVGERLHHLAKLSWEQVCSMRDDHEKHGMSFAECGKKYHCARATARDICTYRTRRES